VVPFYTDAAVTVFHGDAVEVMATLESVDHVITDPPYSEHVHSKSRAGDGGPKKNGRGNVGNASFSRAVEFGFAALSSETRLQASVQFARLVQRWVLAFSDVESSHLWREDLETAELEFIRTGLWVKIGATPQFTGDRPGTGAEAITIAHPKGRKRWNGGGSHAVWSMPIAINRGGANPRHHTTEKPLPLMSRLIGLFTDPGELILDPFAGSGTTGVAAKAIGRRAILVDQDEACCEMMVQRLAQESLFGVAEPGTARCTNRSKDEQPTLFGDGK
jgi:DNA modification methylase